MPSPLSTIRRVPWMRLWIAAQWLYNQGRRRLDQNLTERERRELLGLMRKSRGRRANLSAREQDRFKRLVRQGVAGRRPG
jgi:hypothetical protein